MMVVMKHPLNIIKLCVGAADPSELEAWQTRFGEGPAIHVTRMWPRRQEELLPGGSIYWVFKGMLLARQEILAMEKHEGEDGINRCALILSRDLIRTEPVPRRPFQGWRYFSGEDAPADLARPRNKDSDLPPELLHELADLGLR